MPGIAGWCILLVASSALITPVKTGEIPISESESNSNSYSYSYSQSSSESESYSYSVSQSDAPYTCTEMAAVIDGDSDFNLVFNAGELLPDLQTCKGATDLNPDNTKHTVGHKGLGPKWMRNRNCHCSTYRVCYDEVCINNETYPFVSFMESETPIDMGLYPVFNCHPIMLPFLPTPLLPELVLMSLPSDKRPRSDKLSVTF